MGETSKQFFLQTKPTKLIWQTGFPMLASISALLGYDLAESAFLSRQGECTLIGYGFILPLLTLMTAIAIALTVRSNAAIIKQPTDRTVTNNLLFSSIVVVALSLLIYTFKVPILEMLGHGNWLVTIDSADDTSKQVQLNYYLDSRLSSWVALVMIWQSSAVLRSFAKHKTAAALMLGWMLSKFALLAVIEWTQPLQAIALLGQMHLLVDLVFAGIGLFALYFYQLLNWQQLNIKAAFSGNQSSINLLTQQLLPSVSIAILMAIAARFNPEYVGAFAMIFRFEPLLLLIPMVLSASLPASVGYNFWHGCKKRSLNIIKTALIISVGAQLVLAAVMLTQSQMAFCSECPQQHFINLFFSFVPLSYLLLSLAIIYPACLNLTGQHKQALIIVAFHRLGTPALVLFGFMSQDTVTLVVSFAGANVIAGISAFYFLSKQSKQFKPMTSASAIA